MVVAVVISICVNCVSMTSKLSTPGSGRRCSTRTGGPEIEPGLLRSAPDGRSSKPSVTPGVGCYPGRPRAPLAQLAEQRTLNPQVLGSSPRGGTHEGPGQSADQGLLGYRRGVPNAIPGT